MGARRAQIIELGGGEIGLSVSYDDRDEAKALGGYQWDAGRRCWRFPASRRAECQRVADRLNGRSSSSSSSSSSPPPPRQQPSGGLYEALRTLFAQLPPQTHKTALSGLRKALHPDTGGDVAAMQALNRVAEEMKR